MKLSITVVTLLTGLAAGSPANIKKRQDVDKGGEPLKAFCGTVGLEPDEMKITDDGIAATCKSDPAAPPKSTPSGEDGQKFCKTIGMEYITSGILSTATNAVEVWCKSVEGSEVNLTQRGLKTYLLGLARDVPGTIAGLYNALKAAPSVTKSVFGLGGAAGTLGGGVTALFDFINANTGEGGLFGPETEVGRWLRTNPIYGASGTRSSPFDSGGEYIVYYDSNTKMCIPFKDQTSLTWSVGKCQAWHDKDDCDTSYAYDAETDIGKELRQRCRTENTRSVLPQQERDEQIRKEEAGCIRPRWICGSLGNNAADPLGFQYCMDDSEPAKKACELLGLSFRHGRPRTDEEEENAKEERLQMEEAECFHPRLSCRNVNNKFLYCMDDNPSLIEECKSSQWRPTNQPERSTK